MAGYFDKKYENQSNYFQRKDEDSTEKPVPVETESAQPRETTWPEFIAGLGIDLGIGTMRATKSIPDTLSFVLPDAWTDPWSEFFERGIEASEC